MKLFDWLNVSNRMKHLKAGVIIYICLMLLQVILYNITMSVVNIEFTDKYFMLSVFNNSLVSLIGVAIAMASVEYIQKTLGGIFDWLDILAGCIIPLILTIILSISAIIIL